MLGTSGGHFGSINVEGFPSPPSGSPCASSSGSTSSPVSARCWSRASGGYCYDFDRRWLPFPFGWRSSVVVAGLLAATDSFLPLLMCLLVTPVLSAGLIIVTFVFGVDERVGLCSWSLLDSFRPPLFIVCALKEHYIELSVSCT